MGQPRNADLRRAVSAAYYAVFHQVALVAAGHLLSLGSESEQLELTRHFGHQELSAVFERVATSGTPPKNQALILTRLRLNLDLVDIAQSFRELQQARHAADYDHSANFTRPEVLSLIDSAADAVSKLDALRRTKDMQGFVMLAAVGVKTR